MSTIDIRKINLNLLPALEALLEERNVSAAARRAGVTQSAMSHSLGKLRELLDDPLLIPTGRLLVRSPAAERIARALPSALDGLETSVEPGPRFDPKTSERTFRVATFDYFEVTLLPGLLGYLARHAPRVKLEIERFAHLSVQRLTSGEIDVALVGEQLVERSPALVRVELLKDPFVVMLRRGHPALAHKRLGLATYVALSHVLVSIEGRADGAVDRALERLGKRRRVALRVPHFSSAPLAVSVSDQVCTIASSVAHEARRRFPIELRTPPVELAPALLLGVYAKRVENDPAARWFREILFSGRAAPAHVRRLIGRSIV
jgi:DNA-binding transcriptional LysR family regulator